MRTIGFIFSTALMFIIFTGIQGKPSIISDADWVPIGGIPAGTGGEVEALIFDRSGNLYAGGNFRIAGGDSANYIAKWNGNIWTALGTGMNGVVRALAFDSLSGALYAGGDFTTAGGMTANHIAKWNGSTWSPLGTGTDSAIYALAFDRSGNLFAGGRFISAGGASANCIAKWNGGTWSPLGSGIRGSICSAATTVYAVAVDSSGNLYAGGLFTNAGGVAANFIATWNGNAWSPLGSGMGGVGTLCAGNVFALTFDTSGNLYAGGWFTNAGGVATKCVAKWNGSVWSALGRGMGPSVSVMSPIVYNLAVDKSGNLFASGGFDTAGDVAAKNIAKWNGTAWSALGTAVAVNGVDRLAVDTSGNLYATGNFSNAAGPAAKYLAKWNGTTWSALGSGVNGSVGPLAVDRSGNLYASGAFDTAGGVVAKGIAKWDGSAWSALGTGLHGIAYSLAIDSSGMLYAGGSFDTAGGIAVNHIAKWDGGTWSALGSGVNNDVSAIAIDRSSNLFAGGFFTRAGGKISTYVAMCILNSTAALPQKNNYISRPFSTFNARAGLMHFQLKTPTEINYRIYSLSGRLISHASEFMEAGDHSLRINTGHAARGVYILYFKAGNESIQYRLNIDR